MKKLFTVLVVAMGLIAGTASAQMKIGYIRIDDMVSLMPQTAKVDTLLQQYQIDSLYPQLSLDQQMYRDKDSILSKTDTSKLSKPYLAQLKLERDQHGYRIQNFQGIAQQAIESKQNELLNPIYSLVYDAIKTVAKEKGYTHVLSQDVFLVAPEGDNMLFAVAAKLKVKLPPQLQAQAPASKPAGTKPN
jgi:outer membrane protein